MDSGATAKKRTLFDISRDLADIGDEVDARFGDLTEELVHELSQLEGEFTSKVDKTLFVVDKLYALGDLYAERAKALRVYSAAVEKRAEKLREWVKYNMEVTGISKLSTDHYPTVQIRRSPPSVVLFDELKFFAEHGKDPELTVVKVEPNKAAIKSALTAGKEIAGAHLDTERTHLLVK